MPGLPPEFDSPFPVDLDQLLGIDVSQLPRSYSFCAGMNVARIAHFIDLAEARRSEAADRCRGVPVIDCIECGHPFDPADSPDPEACPDCVAAIPFYQLLTEPAAVRAGR